MEGMARGQNNVSRQSHMAAREREGESGNRRCCRSVNNISLGPTQQGEERGKEGNGDGMGSPSVDRNRGGGIGLAGVKLAGGVNPRW